MTWTFAGAGFPQSWFSPMYLYSHSLSSAGHLKSLLDLVLLSDTRLLDSLEALSPVGNSDHLPVLCVLRAAPQVSTCAAPRRLWCYERADFQKLNSTLSTSDWSAITSAVDVDSAWTA